MLSVSASVSQVIYHMLETAKVNELYLRAMDLDPSDSITLHRYALYLWYCDRTERAEEIFIRCLEEGRECFGLLLYLSQ